MKLLAKLRALFRRQNLETEMAEEMRQHLERRIQEGITAGLSPDEARYAAQREFGGIAQVQERCRDERGYVWLEHVLQDLRYGARTLRKNPGFAIVVVLTLALGIGANATIFSVVDAVLLEPPPYADPARLVALLETQPLAGGAGQRVNVPVSEATFFDWRKQAPSLEQVAAITTGEMTYLGGPEPEQIVRASVSSNFFPMLGVTPILGRNFELAEELPNAGGVVILGHGFWQRRFASDPSVIGQALKLDGRQFTIVGVMPPSFDGAGSVSLTRNRPSQLWLPLTLNEAGVVRGRNGFDVFARLKPGATIVTAQTEIDTIMQRLAKEFPDTNAGRGGRVLTLTEKVAGNAESTLWLLFGAVVLVLLIACSNVANLLFARATLRGSETALRAALGASRGRLVRQFFTESLLLTLLGCAAGLALAWASVQAFASILPQNLPRTDTIAIDGRVLAFTVLVSLLTGITFGLAPAWRGAKTDLNTVLKAGGRTLGEAGSGRTRNTLVVIQVALSLVLLVAAGLLLKSFITLRNVDPGFDPRNVLSLRVNLSPRYSGEDKRSAFFEQLLSELKTLPGVDAATAVFPVPFSANTISNMSFRVPGRPVDPAERLMAQYNVVSPDYFRTLRIRLTQGRAFTERDRVGSPPVVIVNELLARRMWPGENPLGKRLGMGRDEAEVVGVFADIKQRELDSVPRMQMCVPMLQQAQRGMFVAVRGDVAVGSLLPAIRQRIVALDAEVPVVDVALVEERVAGSIRQQRFTMLLLAIFAGTALALAVVGLYGVMSYLVAQRTREFGIRIALGASVRHLLQLVMSQGMKFVVIGLVLGVLGSLALTQALTGLLFGVRPTDPATFVAVSLLLAGVGALACWLPARRAARIDPIVALRAE